MCLQISASVRCERGKPLARRGRRGEKRETPGTAVCRVGGGYDVRWTGSPGDGLLTENQRAGAQAAERPNFVFVLTDDLDERSMDDLPGIRDVMGANGTTFENAYVTFPLCCPSRATILRGQYAHNHN